MCRYFLSALFAIECCVWNNHQRNITAATVSGKTYIFNRRKLLLISIGFVLLLPVCVIRVYELFSYWIGTYSCDVWYFHTIVIISLDRFLKLSLDTFSSTVREYKINRIPRRIILFGHYLCGFLATGWNLFCTC